MPQQMMWSQMDKVYRAQSTNGTLITVNEEAMDLALKKAGKGVFESEWWMETLEHVLLHWGIVARRWVDEATRVPRIGFSTQTAESERITGDLQSQQTPPPARGPLSTRILSNKLSGKLLSGDLET